jgi:hypothetical protein
LFLVAAIANRRGGGKGVNPLMQQSGEQRK